MSYGSSTWRPSVAGSGRVRRPCHNRGDLATTEETLPQPRQNGRGKAKLCQSAAVAIQGEHAPSARTANSQHIPCAAVERFLHKTAHLLNERETHQKFLVQKIGQKAGNFPRMLEIPLGICENVPRVLSQLRIRVGSVAGLARVRFFTGANTRSLTTSAILKLRCDKALGFGGRRVDDLQP